MPFTAPVDEVMQPAPVAGFAAPEGEADAGGFLAPKEDRQRAIPDLVEDYTFDPYAYAAETGDRETAEEIKYRRRGLRMTLDRLGRMTKVLGPQAWGMVKDFGGGFGDIALDTVMIDQGPDSDFFKDKGIDHETAAKLIEKAKTQQMARAQLAEHETRTFASKLFGEEGFFGSAIRKFKRAAADAGDTGYDPTSREGFLEASLAEEEDRKKNPRKYFSKKFNQDVDDYIKTQQLTQGHVQDTGVVAGVMKAANQAGQVLGGTPISQVQDYKPSEDYKSPEELEAMGAPLDPESIQRGASSASPINIIPLHAPGMAPGLTKVAGGILRTPGKIAEVANKSIGKTVGKGLKVGAGGLAGAGLTYEAFHDPAKAAEHAAEALGVAVGLRATKALGRVIDNAGRKMLNPEFISAAERAAGKESMAREAGFMSPKANKAAAEIAATRVVQGAVSAPVAMAPLNAAISDSPEDFARMEGGLLGFGALAGATAYNPITGFHPETNRAVRAIAREQGAAKSYGASPEADTHNAFMKTAPQAMKDEVNEFRGFFDGFKINGVEPKFFVLPGDRFATKVTDLDPGMSPDLARRQRGFKTENGEVYINGDYGGLAGDTLGHEAAGHVAQAIMEQIAPDIHNQMMRAAERGLLKDDGNGNRVATDRLKRFVDGYNKAFDPTGQHIEIKNNEHAIQEWLAEQGRQAMSGGYGGIAQFAGEQGIREKILDNVGDYYRKVLGVTHKFDRSEVPLIDREYRNMLFELGRLRGTQTDPILAAANAAPGGSPEPGGPGANPAPGGGKGGTTVPGGTPGAPGGVPGVPVAPNRTAVITALRRLGFNQQEAEARANAATGQTVEEMLAAALGGKVHPPARSNQPVAPVQTGQPASPAPRGTPSGEGAAVVEPNQAPKAATEANLEKPVATEEGPLTGMTTEPAPPEEPKALTDFPTDEQTPPVSESGAPGAPEQLPPSDEAAGAEEVSAVSQEQIDAALQAAEKAAEAKSARIRGGKKNKAEDIKARVVHEERVNALSNLLPKDGPGLHPVADPDTGEVSFEGHVDPENVIHQAIFDEFGYSREHINHIEELQRRNGQGVVIKDYKAAEQEGHETGEGLEFSGEKRQEEYAASPTGEVGERQGNTTLQDKGFTPWKTILTKRGVMVRGFDHDKFLHNVREIIQAAGEQGLPTGLEKLKGKDRDEALADAFRAVARNHANGWKGDGTEPLKTFPDTGIKQNLDYVGEPVPKELAELVNMAMHIRSARPPKPPRGKKPTELAQKRYAKASDAAKEAQGLSGINEGFLNPETGETNELRDVLEKGGFEADARLKPTVSNLRPDLIGSIGDETANGKTVHAHGFDIAPAEMTAEGSPHGKPTAAGFMPGEGDKSLTSIKSKLAKDGIEKEDASSLPKYTYLVPLWIAPDGTMYDGHALDNGRPYDISQTHVAFAEKYIAPGEKDAMQAAHAKGWLRVNVSPADNIIMVNEGKLTRSAKQTLEDLAFSQELGVMDDSGRTIIENPFPPENEEGDLLRFMPGEGKDYLGNEGKLIGPDRLGPYGVLKGAFMPGEGETPSSIKSKKEDVDPLGFYSGLQLTVEAKLPERGRGDQMLGILKNSGVKQEEMDWMGLPEFLRGKEKVTKKEVNDFIEANRVQLKEVNKGGKSNTEWGEEDEARLSELEQLRHRGNFSDEEEAEFQDLVDRENAYLREQGQSGVSTDLVTKYHSYQIPGGKNYQESVLTMPSKKKVNRLSSEEFSEYSKLEAMRNNFPDEFDGANASRHAELLARIKEGNKESMEGFRSTHFQEPGYLAHLRQADHVDTEGNKVRLAEEFQSDLHLRGKKEGYVSDKKKALDEVRKQLKPLIESQDELTPEQNAEYERLANERDRLELLEPGVPDAPFKSNWYELLFKRLLRKAVEDGMDKVAWTTGATQIDRYDLSKQLSNLEVTRDKDGYLVDAWDKNDNPVIRGRRAKDLQQLEETIGKELTQKVADAKGERATDKEIEDAYDAYDEARRKWNDESGEENEKAFKEARRKYNDLQSVTDDPIHFSGLDLKIGGEGKKELYDKMIPNFVRKYVKKWGGKVEQSTLPATDEKYGAKVGAGITNVVDESGAILSTYDQADFDTRRSLAQRWIDANPQYGEMHLEDAVHDGVKVHSVTITPEMRESVQAGQPMFMPGGEKPLTGFEGEEESSSIKSKKPLSRFMPGEKKPFDARASMDEEKRFGPGFYSQLERTVIDKIPDIIKPIPARVVKGREIPAKTVPDGKGGTREIPARVEADKPYKAVSAGEQAWAILENSPGIKADELDFTDIKKFLLEHEGPLKKEDILDYLYDANVNVTTHDDPTGESKRWILYSDGGDEVGSYDTEHEAEHARDEAEREDMDQYLSDYGHYVDQGETKYRVVDENDREIDTFDDEADAESYIEDHQSEDAPLRIEEVKQWHVKDSDGEIQKTFEDEDDAIARKDRLDERLTDNYESGYYIDEGGTGEDVYTFGPGGEHGDSYYTHGGEGYREVRHTAPSKRAKGTEYQVHVRGVKPEGLEAENQSLRQQLKDLEEKIGQSQINHDRTEEEINAYYKMDEQARELRAKIYNIANHPSMIPPMNHGGFPTKEAAEARAETLRESKAVKEGRDEVVVVQTKVDRPGRKYKEPHFPEMDIVAHSRLQDFEGTDGKKVRLIDEAQSQLHQDARDLRREAVTQIAKEEGITEEEADKLVSEKFSYNPSSQFSFGNFPSKRDFLTREKAEAELKKELEKPIYTSDPATWKVYTMQGEQVDVEAERTGNQFFVVKTDNGDTIERGISPKEAMREALAQREKGKNLKVTESSHDNRPDSPFPGTYADLVFKKALHEAIEDGQDRIGWPMGIEHVKRYQSGLRQAVDDIKWSKSPEGDQVIITATKNGNTTFTDTIPIEGKGVVKGKEVTLDKVIGKTMAGQIRKSTETSGIFEGEDLTIGGEGFKGFYDDIFPKLVQKIVGKFGGKVEQTHIDTENIAKFYKGMKPTQMKGHPDYESLDSFLESRGVSKEEFEAGTEDERASIKQTYEDGKEIRMRRWYLEKPDGSFMGELGEIRKAHSGQPPKYFDSEAAAMAELKHKQSNGQKIWSVDITPQMKEAIEKEGLPIFMPGEGKGRYKVESWNEDSEDYEPWEIADKAEKAFLSSGINIQRDKNLGLVAFGKDGDPVGATMYKIRQEPAEDILSRGYGVRQDIPEHITGDKDAMVNVYDFDIGVKPEEQGGTIGYMLTKKAIQDARSQEADVMENTVINPKMADMLEKFFGFEYADEEEDRWHGDNKKPYFHTKMQLWLGGEKRGRKDLPKFMPGGNKPLEDFKADETASSIKSKKTGGDLASFMPSDHSGRSETEVKSEPTADDKKTRLRSDMMGQIAWLQDQAKAEGYDSVDALSEAEPDKYDELARQWRADHPRYDSAGNQLFMPGTEKPIPPQKRDRNFRKWAGKGAQIIDYPLGEDVDPNKPVVVRVDHGSTHAFNEINTEKGNPENYWGKGFYGTDSEVDAGANYAGEGPDLTNRIERESEYVENIIDQFGVGSEEAVSEMIERYNVDEDLAKRAASGDDEAIKKVASNLLHGGAPMTYRVWMKMKEPLVLEKNGGTRFDALEHYNEAEDTYEENPDSLPMKLYDAIQENARDHGVDAQKFWNEINEAIGGDWDGVTAYDVDAAMRKSEALIDATDDQGNLTSHDFMKEVFRSMGFDGIIMDAHEAFGGGRKIGKQMEMDHGTRHYIVFEPTQVKSATGNKGTFDESNPDMRFMPGEPKRTWFLRDGKRIYHRRHTGTGQFTGKQPLANFPAAALSSAQEDEKPALADFK